MDLRSTAQEGEPWTTLAVVVSPATGLALAYASGLGEVATIALKLFDLSEQNGTDLWAGGTITPGAVWFDTLQTDYGWSYDGNGYNFRHTITAANVTGGMKGGRAYLAEYAVGTQSFGTRYIRNYVTTLCTVGA